VECATQQLGAFPHTDQAEARRAAAGRADGTIVIDRQPHLLGVTHDTHGYPRRGAGVPSRVRDRLLGQAVERGTNHRAEIVELTGQLNIDLWPSPGLTGEPPEVSHALAWSEVRPLGGTQDTYHGAQLGQRSRGRVLDDSKDLNGPLGVRRCDGTSGLGLDDDAGDVVGDRVVEVTRQLLTLQSLGLVNVAGARVRVVADCSAQGCGEQEEGECTHHIRLAGRVGYVRDDQPGQDDHEADRGLPAGSPPEQRVCQDEYAPDARQQTSILAREDPRDVDSRQRAEGDRDRRQRMGAAPPQGSKDHNHGGEHQRAPHYVLAEHRFHHRPRQEHTYEHPIPPHPLRRIRRSRLSPQRAQRLRHHLSSLGPERHRRISRKHEKETMPSASQTPASGPMCPPPDLAIVELPILTTTTESRMTTRQPTTTPEDQRIPVQAKLAAAWTSLMFFYIYIDYFHLYQPGAIDQIRGGGIFEFNITPTLMTVFVAVIGIPALMVMLSMTLPARVNRATNLVAATLYIPVTVFNAAGASWDWALYYGFHIAIEVLLLAFILRSAWIWPRTALSAATPTSRQADRAQQQA
jgi:hypothetical protein